jgi:photosystem I P700 chlorophyll a apoprotein A1
VDSVVGGAAHAAIFMVRDYTPANNYNNLLDRVLRHRDSLLFKLGMYILRYAFI